MKFQSLFLAVLALAAMACSAGVQTPVRFDAAKDRTEWLCYGHYNKQTGARVESRFDPRAGSCTCEHELYEPVVLESTMSADQRDNHRYFVRSYCMPKHYPNLQKMVLDRMMAMELALAQVENRNADFAKRSEMFRKHQSKVIKGKPLTNADEYLPDQLPDNCYDHEETEEWEETVEARSTILNAKSQQELGVDKYKVEWVCHGSLRVSGDGSMDQVTAKYDEQKQRCVCTDPGVTPYIVAGTATAPTGLLETRNRFDVYLSPYDEQYKDVPAEMLPLMERAIEDELTDKLQSSWKAYQIHVYCMSRDVNQNRAMRNFAAGQERASKGFSLANAEWGNATDAFRKRLHQSSLPVVSSVENLPKAEQSAGCFDRSERQNWALVASANDPMLQAARYQLEGI
ncbi:MAG: hypothetical protein ACOYUZ_03575 [Patescibacteria group bacterium]